MATSVLRLRRSETRRRCRKQPINSERLQAAACIKTGISAHDRRVRMFATSNGVRRSAGFTLVELLVGITIIGALMALLLPAVISTIGAGRRTFCQNNMQTLAKAMLAFESAKGRFPGYAQLV